MTICDCGSEKFAVVENYNTCLECGTCHEYAPVMTFSYNHPYNSIPRAYYCRVKRFKQYVRDQNKQILFQNIDEILDLYNYVEFFWGITKGKRRYFFSRKVMLFFIVQRLGLEISTPLLKDQERTEEQLQSIMRLLERGKDHGMKEPCG